MEVLSEHHLPGLARGLSAHRPPRLFLLLRSLHSHRRFDGQSARQVAEGQPRNPLARADRFTELSPDVACLAPGSQRFQPQDPGFIDHVANKKADVVRDLSAAGRQLPALGRRSLPAQPQLHQRDRRRKAARVAVARHRRRRAALRGGRRHMGLGQQRRRRSRRGDGLRGRRADAGDARGGHAAARAVPDLRSASSMSST